MQACMEVPMAAPKVQSIFDLPPDEATEARLDAEAEADYAAGPCCAAFRGGQVSQVVGNR